MTMPGIMQDIKYLSQQIGPRPPLSQAVSDAHQYIESQLKTTGFEVERQGFYSTGSIITRWGPAAVMTLIGLWMTGQKRNWMRSPGLSMLSAAGWSARQARTGTLSWYETIIPQHPAQNLVVTIPPDGKVKQRVVCVAHVDTELNRPTSVETVRMWLGDVCNTIERLPMLAMGLPMGGAMMLRRLAMATTVAQLARLLIDETGTPADGANDNASGVAMLMALGRHLAENPLVHTEVTLAFTESDTIGTRGLEALFQSNQTGWKDAHWIVLDSVGAGELCWCVDESRRPPRPVEELAQQIASDNRHLGLMGRTLSMPDPAAALQAQHLNAIALVGYQREQAQPATFRDRADNLSNIQADMLDKTWETLTKLITAIEELPID